MAEVLFNNVSSPMRQSSISCISPLDKAEISYSTDFCFALCKPIKHISKCLP